jgi:hypothetical protein
MFGLSNQPYTLRSGRITAKPEVTAKTFVVELAQSASTRLLSGVHGSGPASNLAVLLN